MTLLIKYRDIRNARTPGGRILAIRNLFRRKGRELTIGLEVEAMLVHRDTGRPVRDKNVMTDFISVTDDMVYKDYYPHQLEIRTKAHDNPNDCYTDYSTLLHRTAKIAETMGLCVAPTSYLRGVVPCGTHIHIRYANGKHLPFRTAIAAYPFILPLAAAFRDDPTNIYPSWRLAGSPHIGQITASRDVFRSGREKMRDFHWNKALRNGRERVKDVTTLETRIYDTTHPKHTRRLLIAHFNIMSNIIPSEIDDADIPELMMLIRKLRTQMVYNLEPYHNIFGMTFYEYLATVINEPYFDFSYNTLEIMLQTIGAHHVQNGREVYNTNRNLDELLYDSGEGVYYGDARREIMRIVTNNVAAGVI